MTTTKKFGQAGRDPDAPGQLLIRRANRDLDLIRRSAEERGMDYKDFVFAACLEYAEVKDRLIPYLDPGALPTLQHLTAELQRRHRDLGRLEALLQQIRRVLPGHVPEHDDPEPEAALPPEAPGSSLPELRRIVERAQRDTESMRMWTRSMLRQIWRALR